MVKKRIIAKVAKAAVQSAMPLFFTSGPETPVAETISSSATAATLYFTNWEREMVRLMRAAAAARAGNEYPQSFHNHRKGPYL